MGERSLPDVSTKSGSFVFPVGVLQLNVSTGLIVAPDRESAIAVLTSANG